MFMKKQSQPVSTNSVGSVLTASTQQPQALTATMNQLIPLLQQQLLNAKAVNQANQHLHHGRQQQAMTFTQQ